MTKLCISAVVGAVALAGATQLAQAQRAPAQAPQHWCYHSPDGMTDCSYLTLAQCKASRPLNATCFRGRRSAEVARRTQNCITQPGFSSCPRP
jgi:hypothetical protein